MKKTLFALMTVILMPTAFAKAVLADELQHKLIDLDRREDQAHIDLQQAEQDELMGKISSAQLSAKREQYEAAKEALQAELAELPNRGEIEQWLIDNHVGVNQ